MTSCVLREPAHTHRWKNHQRTRVHINTRTHAHTHTHTHTLTHSYPHTQSGSGLPQPEHSGSTTDLPGLTGCGCRWNESLSILHDPVRPPTERLKHTAKTNLSCRPVSLQQCLCPHCVQIQHPPPPLPGLGRGESQDPCNQKNDEKYESLRWREYLKVIETGEAKRW